MFTYEPRSSSFSPALFVFQLIVVPFGCMFLGLIVTEALERVLKAGDSNFLGYLVYSVTGFLLGYRMQTAGPGTIQCGGCFVWVIPICILGWGFTDELGRHPGLGLAVANSFWPGPENRSGAWGMVLFTLPAVASCFYSLGVFAASRPPHSSFERTLRRALGGEGSSAR